MQVDGDAELLCALEDRPEGAVIQESSVCVAVDQRTDESKLAHRALELVGGGLGSRGGKCCEGREALWMCGQRPGEVVVRGTGHLDGLLGSELLGCRDGVGEDLYVDVCRIHLGDAPLADIVELC